MDQDSYRAQFVDAHWATLVQKVNMVMPIADELQSRNMLEREPYCKIQAAGTNQDKMRALYDVLYSGGDKVKSAFYTYLEKHEPYLFETLGDITQSAEAHVECINRYKKWIQKEYEYIMEYNSLPGEHVLLSERYIQPLIIMRHRDKSEREEEIWSFGDHYQELITSRDNADKNSSILDALFSADNKGFSPKSVILQGNSGIGKSFTAQKIMLDWASGNINRESFGCLFHLKCKELNRFSGELGLQELFNSNLTSDEISQILRKSPEKILILIDGFDELRLSHSDASNTPNLQTLLKNLLMGNILSEISLLVTTRSTATKTLSGFLKHPQRFTEIVGFSKKEVKEYFQKFFQDQEHFRSAFECVKANETLLTSCSIPVICWIICTVFQERFRDGADITSGLETTTSIYIDFVSTLLEHHSQSLSLNVPTLLRSLGQLAERGMMEKQVLVDEKTVHETVSDPDGCPFLCKFLFKRRIRQETMFSFMHLSFQEFFTALYYISLDEREFLDKLTKRFHFNGKDFHLKSGCSEPSFMPVIQFLCGLCNKEVSSSLKETHNLSVPSYVQTQLEKDILQFSTSKNYGSLPFILNCLYELHNPEFVKKVFEAQQKLDTSEDLLSRTDCWSLLYCLKYCPHFRRLKLKFAAENLKMLQPVLRRTPELELDVQNFSDTDVTDLLSALGEEKQLHELGLESCLSEESLGQILNALLKQKSVGGFHTGVKSISTHTAHILTDFLRKEKWEEIRLFTVDKLREILYSAVQLFSSKGNLVLNVTKFRSSPGNEQSLSEITLKCPRSEATSIEIKSFLELFYSVNQITEQSPDLDSQVNSLLSLLKSVSGLSEVTLSAPILKETWASRILFLIESCPSLTSISFNAGSLGPYPGKWLPGRLMEEGIKLLKESGKRPDCTVKLRGLSSSKSSDRCAEPFKEIDFSQRPTVGFVECHIQMEFMYCQGCQITTGDKTCEKIKPRFGVELRV